MHWLTDQYSVVVWTSWEPQRDLVRNNNLFRETNEWAITGIPHPSTPERGCVSTTGIPSMHRGQTSKKQSGNWKAWEKKNLKGVAAS